MSSTLSGRRRLIRNVGPTTEAHSMQRDLDLCLQILREFEALPPGGVHARVGHAGSPIPAGIVHHIDLLIDAGLLDGEAHPEAEEKGGGRYIVRKITSAGYDFLQAASNDSVWGKTRARLKSAGSWTFSIALEVLKDEAKKALGLVLS